jgi:ferredoxin
MRIDSDRDVCVGSGQCVLTAPRLFGQDDDDGLVVVLEQPEKAEEVIARRVVTLCPSRALRIAAE